MLSQAAKIFRTSLKWGFRATVLTTVSTCGWTAYKYKTDEGFARCM